MSVRGPALALALVASAGLVWAPGSAHAQDEAEEAEDLWAIEAELGGTLFFGNKVQSQFTSKTEIEGVLARAEVGTEIEFTYGVAEDKKSGETTVSRRNWNIDNTLDFRPEALWRPFLSGAVQSNYQKKIAFRYQAGVGLKYDRQENRNNRIELSIAVLGEKTDARPSSKPVDEGSRARWSSTARIRRTFFEDDRLGIDLKGEYQPVFDDAGNYTWEADASVTFSITEIVGLRMSTKLEYDSRAVARGAKTNQDGKSQMSVVVEL